jgi:thiamine biosynthesis lipoprotein
MNSKYILNNYPALGTYFWIEVFESIDDKKILDIKDYLEKEIFIFENLYSRFKKDSLITKINEQRFLDNPPEELVEMINFSFQIAELTNNTFNLCVGDKLENLGYNSSLTFVEAPNSSKELIPMNQIIKIFDNDIYLTQNYNLDLGGIGKGYLVDKLSQILINKFGIKYFLINGGGDIFVTSDNEDPVEINLQNPLNESEYLGSIFLKNQSICGSSPHKRKWKSKDNSKEYSHIIDPKEENRFNSSFVVGNSATLCDTLATCLCIDEDLLSEFPHVDYLVLNKNGEIIKNTF